MNVDIIFKIALYLLPFDNLIIAPSSGWATITPIIFALYVLCNYKLALKSVYKYKYIFIFFIFGILMSLINYLFVGIRIDNFINALISLFLGLTNLIAFDIFFSKEKNNIDKAVKILIISYSISIFIGLVQFMAIKLNIDILKAFFEFIQKRSYIKYERVQFTFTEPSFIGMHLFGVLLPIYLYSKKKKILYLIGTFAILAILFNSGLRILIDTLVVLSICYLIFFIKNIKNIKIIFCTFLIILMGLVLFIVEYNNNYRFRNILEKGIYADGSLASRYFRINASIKGYKEDGRILLGYGLGNSLLPIRKGFDEALKEYKSSYTKETELLADPNYNGDSESYCLYIRIISEFGLVFLIIIFIYVYVLSKKTDNYYLKNYIWVMLYLYIQFESYAFYTIWLYIVLMNLKNINEKNY